VESFAKVWDKFPAARLVMIGDGPHKKICEMLAARYHLEKYVIFTGAVKYEDVAVVINCLDVALGLASRPRLEREGVVAFKFQEFLACGCPTVAQYLDPLDHKHFSAFVKMVHVDDKPGVVSAILELLEDPDSGSSMAKRALTYVKENVSWEKSARMSIDFMDRMLPPSKDYS
jgi:glycosyltransferase involved in cell wall biosynthesis